MRLIEQLRWWAAECDRTSFGCQARKLLLEAAEALEKADPQWIPVTERLPEIVKTTKAHRNVYRRTDRVLCACLQTNGKRMVKEGYAEFFNDYPEPNWKIPGTIHSVTHWMPLPIPPEDGERSKA